MRTTQESFFDGFVTAFETLDGVPGRVRLDNLKPAVIRVLLGRARLENTRFVLLRSHYPLTELQAPFAQLSDHSEDRSLSRPCRSSPRTSPRWWCLKPGV